MKKLVQRYLFSFTFFITMLSCPLAAGGNQLKVEIFFLSHRPALDVVSKVEQLLQHYPTANVSKYDFDSKESRSKMEEYQLREHTPIAIFINGKNSFVVNSEKVVFRNFPKSYAFVPMFSGDWDYPQLEAVLKKESQ